MDLFKECMYNHVGVGGFKCSCCNCFYKKSKKKLKRMARAKMKSNLNKELSEVKGDYNNYNKCVDLE